MILEDGLIPFVLHLESYLVYGKWHTVGHFHQLRLLPAHLLLSMAGASLKMTYKLCFFSFCRHTNSCCMQKIRNGLRVEYDNQYVFVVLNG